jgi:polar amino acid transport system ATP-binding protein/sulfate transport system ATP-binding protein
VSDYSFQHKEPLVTIEGVSLNLGGRQILKNVSAAVRNIVRPGLTQGQVVGFLGPSGIGKSQLCRIIAGLQEPDSGEVRVGVAQERVALGSVGRVSQNYELFEHRRVMDNLLIAGRTLPVGAAREKARSLLERFGLADHAQAWPASLSGGQRQRIAIAQQLMRGTKLLLMDEPFTGLDPLSKDSVCELITEVAGLDEHFTIIIVAHDIGALVSVADTLWLLGRNRDEKNVVIPNGGASIKKEYDLIERGLAWRKDIRLTTQFSDCVREVTKDFAIL